MKQKNLKSQNTAIEDLKKQNKELDNRIKNVEIQKN